jgi:hypothetical protein
MPQVMDTGCMVSPAVAPTELQAQFSEDAMDLTLT